VDQPDRTVIAAGGGSRIEWRQDRDSGAKVLTVAAGPVYLDVAEQKKPFVIQLGSEAQAEVIGTRLLAVSRADSPIFSVLKGAVRVRNRESAAYLTAGAIATPWNSPQGAGLRVARVPMKPDTLAWLDRLGLDSAGILREAADEKAVPRSAGGIDLAFIHIRGGTWRIEPRADGVAITQEDERTQGVIVFGTPGWLGGDFSCKLRVLRSSGPQRTAQLLFAHPDWGLEAFAGDLVSATPPRADLVFNLRARFAVDPQANAMSLSRIEEWLESAPSQRVVQEDVVKKPEVSGITRRGPCSLGLRTFGCAVEFRDVRLENGVPAPSPATGR
jgi:hypothetical protein